MVPRCAADAVKTGFQFGTVEQAGSVRKVYEQIDIAVGRGLIPRHESASQAGGWHYQNSGPRSLATRAAWRFAAARRDAAAARGFLAAFLRSQGKAESLACPEVVADAEYRYRVQLLVEGESRLAVQCWCRLPGDPF